MQQSAARREDWKTLPLPRKRARLALERSYSPEQYAEIALGFIPREMEDKWFIFLEADRLYLHRSWTGFCLYEARFEQRDGRYHIAEAWVNRSRRQYTETNLTVDTEQLAFLIDRLLLGLSLPVPNPRGAPPGLHALQAFSLFGDARARNEPLPKRFSIVPASTERPVPPESVDGGATEP